jgi:hypothetical protein
MKSRLLSVTTKTRFLRTGAVHEARFVRRWNRHCERIKATYSQAEGWQQWGAPETVLAENVAAVEAWVRVIRAGFPGEA